MDFADFDTTLANEGVDMHVKHPVTGEPAYTADGRPITIRLLGLDSSAYRKHQRKLTNRRLEQGAKFKLTAEQIDEDSLDFFVALTVGWSGVVLDKAELEFTEANVRKFYTRVPRVREQVDAFIGDHRNFLKDSPTD